MKVFAERQCVELTRRNLLSLLAKLDGHPPNSFCSIARQGWTIQAVEDSENYSDRPPGLVHPDTRQHAGLIEGGG